MSPDHRWRKKLIKQLQMNFKIDLRDVYEGENLVDINMGSIEYSRQKLNISTPILLSSEIKTQGKQSEKLVNLCNSVGATSYLSGPFGKDYLDISLFDQHGIKVDFFEPRVNNYYSILYNLYTKGT